jgi:FkbM family methyltransferase
VEKFQRRFRSLEIVTRGNALRFDVPTRELYLVFKEIFLTDFYSVRELVRALPPEPVVIDVGANAGYFGMMLFSQLGGARMYAFEPIEENHRIYAANIARNPELGGRITLRGLAVTGTPAENVELFADASGASVTASVFPGFDCHNTRRVRASAVTLADVLREHQLDRVDLLKLDCEGSEYSIIYGSPRRLWPLIDTIVLEAHELDRERRNVRALQHYLEGLGYRCSTQGARNGCHELLARHGTAGRTRSLRTVTNTAAAMAPSGRT